MKRERCVGAALLAALLVSALFLGLTVYNLRDLGVSSQPRSLEVSVNPSEAKLRPNQPQTFIAIIANLNETVGEVTYVWGIEDADGRFMRDGDFTDYAFTSSGNSASCKRKCALKSKGAKNLDSALETKTSAGELAKLPQDAKGLIAQFLAYLEKEGYSEETQYPNILRRLVKLGADLRDPKALRK